MEADASKSPFLILSNLCSDRVEEAELGDGGFATFFPILPARMDKIVSSRCCSCDKVAVLCFVIELLSRPINGMVGVLALCFDRRLKKDEDEAAGA